MVTGGDFVPVFGVLLVIEVLTPLNEPIYLLVEFSILHFYQILVIEGVII